MYRGSVTDPGLFTNRGGRGSVRGEGKRENSGLPDWEIADRVW